MSPETDICPLYEAVIEVTAEGAGETVSAESLGMVAWERLSGDQRRAALSTLLVTYVMRVHREESERQLEQAVWDDTHTYLAEFDTAMLWDSVHTPANKFDEVPADINSLRNALCELDLLQHRLAMRDAKPTTESEGK